VAAVNHSNIHWTANAGKGYEKDSGMHKECNERF